MMVFAKMVGAIVILLCSLSAQGAPPEYCLLRREAWCLAEGPSKVTVDLRSGFASWQVFSGLHEDRYFQIVEQPGCNREPTERNAVAKVEILGITPDGRSAKIRVRMSGSCSLAVTLPIGTRDLDKDVYFLVFSTIRPCSKYECKVGALTSQREAISDELNRMVKGP